MISTNVEHHLIAPTSLCAPSLEKMILQHHILSRICESRGNSSRMDAVRSDIKKFCLVKISVVCAQILIFPHPPSKLPPLKQGQESGAVSIKLSAHPYKIP